MRTKHSLYQVYAEGAWEHPSWEPVEGTVNWKKLRTGARKLPKISDLPKIRTAWIPGNRLMSGKDLLGISAGSPAMKSHRPGIDLGVGCSLAGIHHTCEYRNLQRFCNGTFAIVWYREGTYDFAQEALTFEGILLGETKVKELIRKHAISQELDSKFIAFPAVDQFHLSQLETAQQRYKREPAVPFFDESKIIESSLEKKVKPVLESEVKFFEKAAEAALERTLANIAVLLGICIATGLSPWTSTKSMDATSTQLGSYGLLLSASTGLLALTSSLSHFSTITDSAGMLLRLKEQILSARVQAHLDPDRVHAWSQHNSPRFGFLSTHSPIPGYHITTKRLLHSMTKIQWCWSVFVGPVLPFLPIYPVGRGNTIELQVEGIKLFWSPYRVQEVPMHLQMLLSQKKHKNRTNAQLINNSSLTNSS
ncbi:hypothetical protein F5Y03DRAFT_409944 [Xylaria venustula]|nr:hypothetical protein F5Y03DRAFT_409944 [Xylaria venustula]